MNKTLALVLRTISAAAALCMSVIYGWMIFYSSTYMSVRIVEDEYGRLVQVLDGRKLLRTTIEENLPFIAGIVIAVAIAVFAVITLVRFRKMRCAVVLTVLVAVFIAAMPFVTTDIAEIYILRYVFPGALRNIIDSFGVYAFLWLKYYPPAVSLLFMLPTFFVKKEKN